MIGVVGHFFHMSTCTLYVLFAEVSTQVFCPLLNWIVCLLGFDLC